MAERRTAAAEQATLTYAGILAEVAAFARDKSVDNAQRLGAYRLVTEHLARITPVASPVADTQGEVSEARAAALALGVLEAAIAGRPSIAQALEMVQAARAVIEPIAAATLAGELRADAEQPASDRLPPPPASDPGTRPTWLRPAPAAAAEIRAEDAA